MENREAYWENMYSSNTEVSEKDFWLDCYMHLFKTDDRIIELGCGSGNLSEGLINKGYNILSTDISQSALDIFKARIPEASVMQLDLIQKLPFNDSYFDIVIADLCLHYFSSEDTEKILNEIRRVLTDRGYLFARVNSDRDVNHGAGKGIELEKGFYNQGGHYKRFFTPGMVKYFFRNWSELSVSEKTTSKYTDNKHVIEIIARD